MPPPGLSSNQAEPAWTLSPTRTAVDKPPAPKKVGTDWTGSANRAARKLFKDTLGIEDQSQFDGLVSNAGIMIRKPIKQLALAEWSQVIGTNLTATFLLARAAEDMLRAARGSIVATINAAISKEMFFMAFS